MKQTWPIRLFKGLGFVLVGLFLLDWYVLIFSPPWITLPDTFIIPLSLLLSVYALVLHKLEGEKTQRKIPPLAIAIVVILVSSWLLYGCYQLWNMG